MCDIDYLSFFCLSLFSLHVDYRRRVYLMQSLSALYMSSFKVYQEGSSQFLPLLCLKNPKNVAHFLDIRSIFKEFGL